MSELIPACTGAQAYIQENVTANGTFLECVNGSWGSVELASVVSSFDISQLPAGMLAQYFAAGFGLYVLFWAVSEPARQVLKTLFRN